MAIEIKNHSDGTIAGVTKENQLQVVAEMHELEHHISWHKEFAFSAHLSDTGITATTQTIAHIKNTSSTKKLVIDRVTVMDLTTITTHVVGHYFELGVGRTYASDGVLAAHTDTGAAIVNLHRGSGKVAEATIYYADPTMAGLFTPIERIHTILGERREREFHDSLILDLNDTFEVRMLSTGTGGAYVHVDFLMVDNVQ